MRFFYWMAALALLVVTGASAQEQPARTSPTFLPYVEAALSSGKTGAEISAIVHTDDPDALEAIGLRVQARFPGFVTVRGSAEAVVAATSLPSVQYVDAGSEAYPENDGAAALVGAKALHQGTLNDTPYRGEGVIVCVLDSGIDWRHRDFRDPADTTRSRILRIWDQLLTAQTGESAPTGLGLTYGVEYTQAQIEAALAGGTALRTFDIDGHGTHVAGTAVGNGASLSPAQHVGIAPEADLVVIKAGDGSFTTSNIVNGISYCDKVATAEGKPAVMNMSLGSQFGAHDGKGEKEIAASTFGAKAGRVAVFSAGNDGGSNLHVSGSASNGGTTTFTFTVPAYTPAAGSGNDRLSFDLWFDGSNDVTATLRTPGGAALVQTAGSQQTHSTAQGSVNLFNALNPGDLLRRVNVQISDASAAVTPASGTWTLEIKNNGAESMGYHGWIYDNGFGEGQTATEATLAGSDALYTLSNTPMAAITVASYVHRWRWCADDGRCYGYNGTDASDGISGFSSAGPTRDGRALPHIAAPGQGMVSSLSGSVNLPADHSRLMPGRRHWLIQGTSMASPVVAGAIALLMQQDPTLNYTRALALLQSEADGDANTGTLPNTRWGAGKLDVFGAMARLVNATSTANREVLAYDDFSSTGAVQIPGTARVALRFTPTGSGAGVVTGALFHTSTDVELTGPMNIEVWTDDGGVPGTKIGNTVSLAAASIEGYGWTYADLSAGDAELAAGQSYFLMLSLTNSADTYTLLHDGAAPTGRSIFSISGGAWNAWSSDFRIRPIVASNVVTTDAAGAEEVPTELALKPAFPNPFSGEAEIQFAVPRAGAAKVEVYNTLGQRVAVLFDETATPGQRYRLRFRGDAFASGVYVYRLTHEGQTLSRTITLVR